MKKILSIALLCVMALTLFAGCGGKNGVVNVYNWGEYIDETILKEFEKETGIKVNYKTFETNEGLYSVLRQGGVSYDVIIPSDYMVSRMISEDMLEKLDVSNIPNLGLISDEFKNREYDPTGEYSVPYMWGTTGIIYNTAMIDEEIDSWGALFDERYSKQILMFDNSRDAFGIALKYLGYSLNTTDSAQMENAFNLMNQNKGLWQAYVMDQIYDKLESGEAAIGPYYAGDYISMLENNPDLAFVVPKEGSNQFVDLMCVPKGAPNKGNAEKFIDFMCRTDISTLNSEFIGYTSPNSEVEAQIDLDDETRAVMYPSQEILSRCEFFVNLPQATLDKYDSYWVELKK
jgi:spermidine/putrescine transport system substrate-binding protein